MVQKKACSLTFFKLFLFIIHRNGNLLSMYILDFPEAVPFSLFSRKILIVFLCILSWHRKTHSSCLNRKCERPDLEFYFQFPGTVSRFYFQSCNRREGWCARLPVEFPFSGSSSSSGSALLWLSVFFFLSKHCFQVPWRWPKLWSQCPMLRITFVCQHCLGVVFSLPLLTAISPWESPLQRVVIAITYASCPSLD